MDPLFLVILTVIVALAFDVINGFHDSANSIATVVSTRVLSPRAAVIWAAFFNFVAMFVFAPRVADTVSKIVHIDASDPAYMYVVLTGLLGAIVWDLMTWWWGLPTSSSHALIGGLVGAGIAHKGVDVIQWSKVMATVEYIPLAPLFGMILGFAFMVIVYWMFRRWRPISVDNLFRRGQLVSAALYSLGHGGNDAQKTMGVIVALLVAAGYFTPDVQLSLLDWHTSWIILSCQIAMSVGTAFGGWRIVKTMGMRITKLKPVGGFCAETAGAATLFIATHLGIPVSTTHTITGAIVGVGSTTKFSTIRWGVARRIIWAWVFTIPFSALVAALCFWAIQLIVPSF
ncbi:MAG: inorganic phosphate transporter [Candidatus Hydrogenedentes bacterium]|nr:inorganic phosphate transporter [Candidatus Hydrogenedentota bacterium]